MIEEIIGFFFDVAVVGIIFFVVYRLMFPLEFEELFIYCELTIFENLFLLYKILEMKKNENN